MSAAEVERIKDAIHILEMLQAESNPGPWSPVLQEEAEDGSWARFRLGKFTKLDADFNDLRDYADAQLISILHRTIKAQIDILRLAVEFVEATPNAASHSGPSFDLVDAILGSSS